MKKVAVVVQDGVEAFGLGAMCEVWNEPYHPEEDNPVFDFVICTPKPGRVRGSSYDVHVEAGLDAADDADLVCFVPKRDFLEQAPEVTELVRHTLDRGATVFAHCTAAFTLGAAGVLDGRECTTHWRYADLLARMYPEAKVRPEVLYVVDRGVVSGAGSAAGLDSALHLLRTEFGAKVAADAARRIVLPPHRDGGQAQFIRQPMPECTAETLGPVLTWVLGHLDQDLSVETLADRAAMSPRTFARRFVAETGATPHGWVTAQRIRLAEQLLEETDLPVEQVARRAGFSSAATMRQQFAKARGVSPHLYRRRFGAPVPG